MDPSSYVESIAAILAILLFICCVLRSITRSQNGSKEAKGKTKHNKKVPELNGVLPIIGHLHLLNPKIPYFRTFSSMAEKYGPIFSLRLGCHQAIVVSDREIAKECLTTNDKVFASRPDTAAGRYIGYNNAILGLAPYGPYWREMRKMATLELLSSHRLEKLKHVRDEKIYSLVKKLYSCSSKSVSDHVLVHISDLLEHLTFGINAQMIAGKRFSGEAVSDNEGSRLMKALKDATYLCGVFVVADAIPFLGWFDFQGYVGFMKRTAKELDSILHKWMDEHLKKRAEDHENGNECNENDFMDVLISTFEEHDTIYGHKREIAIKATALILMLTGSESTSITSTWALSLLLNHPRALKAAQEELDTFIGKHKWVQESDIKDLKYLQAIVKETLRLYPPAPLTGIREATHDCCVAGYNVKKGTRLFINLWKLHRDPEMWSNPDEFQPERFLTNCENVDFRGQNFEFIPFSYGRRSCPGMTFGMQVVHLTLARLIQGFDMFTENGDMVDMSEGLGVALPKQNELEIILKPRLPLELYECL